MAIPDDLIRFSLSVSDRNFLTFDEIPGELNRSIVPLVEMWRLGDGSAVVMPVGTGFVIGLLSSTEVVLATASHNIPDKVRNSESNLVVLFPKRNGQAGINSLQGFTIDGVSSAETSSDVALMTSKLDDSVVMPALMPLGMEKPQMGENCLALGYSRMVIGQPTELQADALLHVSSSRGKIEVLYPSYRDSVKITFPCFQTDAFYEQGMSGGPVLGTSGRAIGIVSSCMESGEEGIPHTSHVALAAGMLELPLPAEGEFGRKIADLAAAGLVSVEGVATVTTRSEGHVTVSWPTLGETPT
jgi:S1-C subfamily serine protease